MLLAVGICGSSWFHKASTSSAENSGNYTVFDKWHVLAHHGFLHQLRWPTTDPALFVCYENTYWQVESLGSSGLVTEIILGRKPPADNKRTRALGIEGAVGLLRKWTMPMGTSRRRGPSLKAVDDSLNQFLVNTCRNFWSSMNQRHMHVPHVVPAFHVYFCELNMLTCQIHFLQILNGQISHTWQ